MKKKHLIVLTLIIFMTIGFATLNTVLDVLGNVELSFNEEDFKIEISNLTINNDQRLDLLSTDKQSFSLAASENDAISYTVTNYSHQYDTEIDLICTPTDNITVEQIGLLEAQSENKKNITVAQESETTCQLRIEKLSRTKYAEDSCELTGKTDCAFDYTGSEREYVAPYDGVYQIELWGASGGNAPGIHNNVGGKGAYVKGNVSLTKGTTLFINIGGQGENANNMGIHDDGNKRPSMGGYNGGGNVVGYGQCVGAGGGGATHVALVSGLLSTLSGQRDKVLMVASAGGGASLDNNNRTTFEGSGGAGGILKGYDGKTVGNTQCLAYGATQSSGGRSCTTSIYGYFGGSNYTGSSVEIDGGGGGAGYYGGGNSICSGGGGGSSYINENTIFTSLNAEYLINNIVTYDGESKDMPTHSGKSTMTGNSGNGYAKITYLGE